MITAMIFRSRPQFRKPCLRSSKCPRCGGLKQPDIRRMRLVRSDLRIGRCTLLSHPQEHENMGGESNGAGSG